MADVILISGSPRANGNTEHVLNVCKEAIESAGLMAKVLTLRGNPIQSCIACGQCGKLGKCALNDGLNEMLPEIREADGFIVGVLRNSLRLCDGSAAAGRHGLPGKRRLAVPQGGRTSCRCTVRWPDSDITGNADAVRYLRYDYAGIKLLEHRVRSGAGCGG